MLLDCFRGMYRAERERVLRDNRKKLIRLQQDLERTTEALKLLENEHLLIVLKESNKAVD